MALNIKNEHVHELAREAARRAGTTQTSAIKAALEQYVARLGAGEDQHRADKRARAEELLGQFRSSLTDEDRAVMRRDLDALYDDEGLPA